MTIGSFLLLFLSITVVSAFPNATIGTDSTNDVERISWSQLSYDYDNGDYKDDIDIVSAAVEGSGDQVTLSITFQAAPVFDGTHLYWVWISFVTDGEQGSDAGAWFYAGGFESGSAEAFWWIWKDTTDFGTFGTGDDDPVIAGNNLSWVTNSTYWDNLGNSGNWEVAIWAWTSDGTSFAASATSGVSYWDYYPNDDSAWESDATTTEEISNGNGDEIPGFELFVSIATLTVIPILIKKRRK